MGQRTEPPMSIGTVTLNAETQRDVTDARRALRSHLDRWGCACRADALLVFSELVTNAVTHGGGAAMIVVDHGERDLRLEVHDRTRDPPRARDVAGDSGGFGLRIV